jgi:hypothetical protein
MTRFAKRIAKKMRVKTSAGTTFAASSDPQVSPCRSESNQRKSV